MQVQCYTALPERTVTAVLPVQCELITIFQSLSSTWKRNLQGSPVATSCSMCQFYTGFISSKATTLLLLYIHCLHSSRSGLQSSKHYANDHLLDCNNLEGKKDDENSQFKSQINHWSPVALDKSLGRPIILSSKQKWIFLYLAEKLRA